MSFPFMRFVGVIAVKHAVLAIAFRQILSGVGVIAYMSAVLAMTIGQMLTTVCVIACISAVLAIYLLFNPFCRCDSEQECCPGDNFDTNPEHCEI